VADGARTMPEYLPICDKDKINGAGKGTGETLHAAKIILNDLYLSYIYQTTVY
jgi:hypothetical protein